MGGGGGELAGLEPGALAVRRCASAEDEDEERGQ
jgi:hypothetical protein